MEVSINDQAQIVEVWLTNADQADLQVMQEVQTLRSNYRGTKYMVIEYRSGQGDLYAQTRDLLLHNRIALAKQQVQAHCRHSPIMEH